MGGVSKRDRRKKGCHKEGDEEQKGAAFRTALGEMG